MEKKSAIRRRLFLSTLYLSAFTFGGGYVIVSLLKNKFVDQYHWIDEEEMMDLVAIAQSSPGAIAVNGAIVIGYKLAGVPGVLVSVLGAVIPPMIILSLVSVLYSQFISNPYVSAVLNGMKSGIGAVIMSVVYDMGSGIAKGRDLSQILIAAASFILSYFFGVNVIFIILAAALFGAVRTVIAGRRKKQP